MSNQQQCPLCEGKGKKQIDDQVLRCPVCTGFGQVGEVGLNRYKLAVNLDDIDQVRTLIDFPLDDPDLPWEV